MKKLLAMVLALVMTLSLAVSANAAFKDDKDINDTYAEAAAVLDGMGVFEGIDGNFLPKDNITRAQVAAIIYRVTTTDTAGYGKDKSGLYASYNKFSDMTGAGWAAGYIGYAANAEYVKGYPDGTFKPSGNVTGYEVLAMILRAIGYDKNNEFSGSDWALHVAQTAQEAGILKNIKGVDLNAAASRELVAEMLFRAIAVAPMVTYTAAFGYQTVSFDTKKDNKLFKENETLGHKNFLLESDDAEDIWGRPTTKWFKDKDENGKYTAKETVYAEITAKADAEFHEPTTQCDICEALSEKTSAKVVEVYVNGDKTSAEAKKLAETYKATETKATAGEQGRISEYYAVDGGYRLVVIDTYLAKVLDVVTEKTDSKNHVTRDDCMKLEVYGIDKPIYVEGNDYAEDDYVLVQVNAVDKTEIITSTNASADKYPTTVVLGKAESFVGAQSKIYKSSNKFTIGGTDYMKAYCLSKNDAGIDGSVKYTWFLDQFGNVIGSVSISDTSYAVLKEFYWTGSDRNGYAQAVLVDMDGEESTVTVKSIDGVAEVIDKELTGKFDTNKDDVTPRLSDSENSGTINGNYAYVSAWDTYNKAYKGMALFMVETNEDGTVNLQGIVDDKTENDAKVVKVLYANNATLKSDSTVMSVTEGNKTTKYAVTNSTKIIVREVNDKDEYVYNTSYTLKTLNDYAEGGVEVYFTVNENGYVTNIYVKSAVDESAFGKYIFMPKAAKNESNYYYDTIAKVWMANVYVDGELQTIQLQSETLGDTLYENAGKLMLVGENGWSTTKDSTYGQLQKNSLTVVSEKNDADKWDKQGNMADYITKSVLKDNVLISSNDINTDKNYIDLEGAKAIFWDDASKNTDSLTEEQLKDYLDDGYALWAVSKETKREGVATALYFGKKLDTNLDLDVTVAPADAGEITVSGTTYTFTSAAGVTTGKLALAAKAATSSVDVKSIDADAEKNVTFTVTNEAGLSKAYTVVVKLTAAVDKGEWVKDANVTGQYWNGTTKEIYVTPNVSMTLQQYYTANHADSMTYDYNGNTGLTYYGDKDTNKNVQVTAASNVKFVRGAETWTLVSSMD